MLIKRTEEQDAIVASDTDFLRVAAFAGTGKTSTLVEFARSRPKSQMLYVAFNKAIQMEAQSKFPSNTVCRTSHGLAFAKYGTHYHQKIVTSLRPHQVLAALGQKAGNRRSFSYAKNIIALLLEWFASDKSSMAEVWPQQVGENQKRKHFREVTIEYAGKVWEMMCNPADSRIGMLHDGYLKLYQLSNPRLAYDYILFDEVQDSNPVTADIVVSQRCRKVFVGDSHQQIYSFRGAVDAMSRTDFTQTLYLTGSFRFTQSIAEVANALLKIKGEKQQIRGLSNKQEIKTRAVITRGNARLFEEAVLEARNNGRLNFVGGIKGYKFDLLRDIHSLIHDKRSEIRDDFIRLFDDFDALAAYADSMNERDLIAWCRVAAKYSDAPQLIERIESVTVNNAADATLSLTTAHKSKGLEFGEVTIGKDFPSIFSSRDDPEKLFADVEEINLLYVASTRAQCKLNPGSVVGGLLRTLSEYPAARISEPINVLKPASSISHAEMLEPLLSERDPMTGGQLSVDYLKSGQVKEALRAAIKLLQNASIPPVGAKVPHEIKNAGSSWSPEEDAKLFKANQAGVSIKDLARQHHRSEGAIRSRLEKLPGKLVGTPMQAALNGADILGGRSSESADAEEFSVSSFIATRDEGGEGAVSAYDEILETTHSFNIGDRVLHDEYGRGVVEGIWGGAADERADINFVGKGNIILEVPNPFLRLA